MPLTDEDLARRAAELEWLLLDVDGVLTDGGLAYGARGPSTLRFHVRDGMGIRLAQGAGLRVGVISGRASRALEKRAVELDLDPILTGSRHKERDFDAFLEREQLSARQVAFVGDDINDLIVLGRSGLSFAPADAVPEVLAVVDRTLSRNGGDGVVREMIEVLLKARGEWDRVLSAFSFESR